MKFKYNLLLLFFCVALPGYAQQGNYKFNNFGNRSILLAGNVTGSVSDLGLTYYNPSFLADSKNMGFSLNAKAYQLVTLKLDNVLDENTQVSNTSFNGASTMAGGIFNLFGTRFAYSYLTRSNDNTDIKYDRNYLDEDILSLFPNAEKHNAKLGLNSKLKDDWAGLAWAYKLTEQLGVGISAFTSIYDYRGKSTIDHTVKSADNEVAFLQNIISFKQRSYGLFIKVGANYHFPEFDLGVNINLPYIEVYQNGKFNYLEVVAGVDPQYDKFVDNELDDIKAKRKEPLGISVGAGIPVKKNKLHINVDYVTGLSKYHRLLVPDIDTGNETVTPVNFDEERKAVVNFGIGLEVYLSKQLKGYGGFSTDFSAFKNSANIIDLAAEENKQITIGEDFYHLSLGTDWKLNWASIILGFTYTRSSASFASPYRLNAEGFEIANDLDARVRYSRWQCVVGLEIPFLEKKVNSLLGKQQGANQD